jgi:hypothetical protein
LSGRHKKQLSEPEIARFLEAATALHMACCEPRFAPWSEHFQALDDVNQAICTAQSLLFADVLTRIVTLRRRYTEWMGGL